MRFVVRLAADDEVVYDANKETMPMLLDTAIQASEIVIYPKGTKECPGYWWVVFKFSRSLENQLKQKGKKIWTQWGKVLECLGCRPLKFS